MSITVVSCYYKIKSKRSHDCYDIYIDNLFNNINTDVNFVVFTSKDLENYLLDKTKLLKNIKIIVKEFEEIELLRKYENIWENQYNLDFKKDVGRGIECYVLWNSKLNFVKESIQHNFFNSDKFIWMDIGMIRNNDYLEDLKKFPQYDSVSNEKIDIVLLSNFTDPNQKFFQDEVHFSGAMYGGGINAFTELIELYYKKFDEYLVNNKFIGCDQQVISSVYLENMNLINPITAVGYTDPWFYLVHTYSSSMI